MKLDFLNYGLLTCFYKNLIPPVSADYYRSCVKKGYMKDDYIHFFVRKPVRRSPIINRGRPIVISFCILYLIVYFPNLSIWYVPSFLKVILLVLLLFESFFLSFSILMIILRSKCCHLEQALIQHIFSCRYNLFMIILHGHRIEKFPLYGFSYRNSRHFGMHIFNCRKYVLWERWHFLKLKFFNVPMWTCWFCFL